MNNIKRFGSLYGGKSVLDHESLRKGLLISAGAGEDISFDIEMINYYNLQAILLDPTPRSKTHINKVFKNMGYQNTSSYSNDGNQSVSSYDLRKINKSCLHYMELALSDKKGYYKFYSPLNQKYVSHSLINNSNLSHNFFQVYTTTYSELSKSIDLAVSCLKLDIEGSEISVIEDVMNSTHLPLQICVELDFIKTNKISAQKKLNSLVNRLEQKNYKLLHVEGFEYLFVQTHLFE